MPSQYMGMSITRQQTMPWLRGTPGSLGLWAQLGREEAWASAAPISPSGGLMATSRCTTLSLPR